MKIPIHFLGTGQAIPTAKRNHTAMLLKYKDETILVDCGEGTQRQIRKAKINPCKITRILITHWHGDHVLGIPGLLQTLALNNYNKTLHIYGPKGTEKFIGLMCSLFVYKESINIKVKEISSGKVFETPDFIVESKRMEHGTLCNAYSFTEKEKLRIDKEKLKIPSGPHIQKLKEGKDIQFKGEKIKSKDITYKEKGKKITFVLDTRKNKNIKELAKNSDLLISESTYTEDEADRAKEYKHMTAKQVGKIAKESKVEKLILTHLSQRYENKEKEMLEEAKKEFKNVKIAKDLEKIEV